MESAGAFHQAQNREREASTATAPAIEHAAHLHHSRLALPEHVINRRPAAKHRAAIAKRYPLLRQRLAEVNVQSFVDSNNERNSDQRILIQLFSARLRLPRVKCG